MSEPVAVKREDLLILWTVRPAKEVEGAMQLRGRVYYKDDPILPKPRMLAEVYIPKEVVGNCDLTMKELIEFAEERVELDVHEIAGTGPFAGPDNPPSDDIENLRECMRR